MKRKLVVKKPSYEGCDSEIAEELRKGNSVKCKVWDSSSNKHTRSRWVMGYVYDQSYPYKTENDMFVHAEPVYEKKVYVKKASEIMRLLEDNGWKVDEDGNWRKTGKQTFVRQMFKYCGREPGAWKWEPEWLEER